MFLKLIKTSTNCAKFTEVLAKVCAINIKSTSKKLNLKRRVTTL